MPSTSNQVEDSFLTVEVPPYVGSPDQNEDPDTTPSARPKSTIGSPELSSPRRPSLGQRSFTTPYSPQINSARSVNTPRHSRFTSNLRKSNSGAKSPLEHQWTLFGQVLENEQQGSESRRIKRRPTHLLSPSASFGGYLPSAPIFEDRTSRVQSPVEDLPLSRDGMSEEYDSDDSETSETLAPSARPSQVESRPRWYSPSRLPTLSNLHRSIIKCVIAYFIASLFTFSPYLSSFISDITSDNEPGSSRPSPAGHMVATVAVYFNPAKTIGGMVEADMYCLLGLAYASFISLSSMAMFWWIDLKPGLAWLADLLAILWIGIGMAGVTWTKAWMNTPSFGTACSMTVIVLFVVVVNEGGLDTLLSVSFIVLVGAIVSNLVCYIVWPQSATVNLQDNMTKTLDSFSTLLNMVTNTFLLEEPLHHRHKLQKAVESHQASFTSLKKNLTEAHSEWFYGGPSGNSRLTSGRAYEDAVDSLNRLAQHLNGLRSGTRLQYDLTKAHAEGKVVLKNRTSKNVDSKNGDFGPSGSNGNHKSAPIDGKTAEVPEEDNELLQAAASMFGDLVDDLGPPMKALSTACSSGLKRLREAFVKRRRTGKKDIIKPQEFIELVDGIERALFTFESTSNHALMRLYQKSDISATPSRNSLRSFVQDYPVEVGGENETVFLVYFFIFTLQEFAQELINLVDAMSRIYGIEQDIISRGSWGRRILSNTSSSIRSSFKRSWRAAQPGNLKRPGLQRRLSAIIMPRDRRKQPSFPKVKPHAPNTMHTPPRANLTFSGRVKQSMWALGARLQENDLKYAFKAGMGMAILAAPAFFDATRPVFMEYRGEWALISFFLVISPTIGATNFLSFHRVLGTLIGAAVAAAFFELFSGNSVVLAILGAIYSIPCFYYIITTPTLASPARFNLLTYNLICLYCYNLRELNLSVVDVAWHRSVAVIVGVVWAALLSRFWWPAQARRELSKALSEFCLNIGWLYTRLVASYSFAPEMINSLDDDDANNEGTPLLSRTASTKLNNSIQEFMAMELHLQIKLIELQGLLAQTQHEPRLKGPFPVPLYRSILTSLQTILDKLHSMRCVTTREEWYTTVRQDFIIPVNKERHEMVGNIILYFSTLSSAFHLKAPLPPYLPPAEKSRQRLVDAIRRLDIVKNREVKGSRQLLYFAYTLMMQGVIQELDFLGRTLQNAFGVIGESPGEFDALFRDERNLNIDIVV